MSRIALIKPPYDFFPIGMAHIMGALTRAGIAHDFFDLSIPGVDPLPLLAAGGYDIVGVGALAGNYRFLSHYLPRLKTAAPDARLVLGGNITRDMDDALLFGRLRTDIAVIGEGEITFVELISCLRRGGDPGSVQGIRYVDTSGRVVRTPKRPHLNLKLYDPRPDWSQVDMGLFLDKGSTEFASFRGIPVLTGRGCTGKCTLCSPTNGPFRARDIDKVMEELCELDAMDLDYEGFLFYNEILYPTKALILRFLDAYRATGIGKPWGCHLRTDVDAQVLAAMRDCGCQGILFGYESGCDRVLEVMRKNTTVENTRRFVAAGRKADVPILGGFMFGNETETAEEMMATVDTAIELDIYSCCFPDLVIAYPGTQIYAKALAGGRIPDPDEYARKLHYGLLLGEGMERNVGYLNLSALPDDEFFPAVRRAHRRFMTHIYTRCHVKDKDPHTLKGVCSRCGHPVCAPVNPLSPFGPKVCCPRCFAPVGVQAVNDVLGEDYPALLGARLGEARRILVWGCGVNAQGLMRYDMFGLPYERLLGAVDDCGAWPHEWFFDKPRFAPEDMPALKPDLILAADVRSAAHLRQAAQACGLAPEAVVPLLPPRWWDYVLELCGRPGEAATMSLKAMGQAGFAVPDSPEYPAWLSEVAGLLATRLGERPAAILPAGRVGQDLAKALAGRGARIVALADNFPPQGVESLGGLPLVKPAGLSAFAPEAVVLATPNADVQAALADQAGRELGPEVEPLWLSEAVLSLLAREHRVLEEGLPEEGGRWRGVGTGGNVRRSSSFS